MLNITLTHSLRTLFRGESPQRYLLIHSGRNLIGGPSLSPSRSLPSNYLSVTHSSSFSTIESQDPTSISPASVPPSTDVVPTVVKTKKIIPFKKKKKGVKSPIQYIKLEERIVDENLEREKLRLSTPLTTEEVNEMEREFNRTYFFNPTKAEAVYREMVQRGVPKSAFSLSLLALGFGEKNRPLESMRLFKEIRADPNFSVDIGVINNMIFSAAKCGDEDGALHYIKYLNHSNLPFDKNTYLSIMHIPRNLKSPLEIKRLITEMEEKGIELCDRVFALLLESYKQNFRYQEAEEFFQTIRSTEYGNKPRILFKMASIYSRLGNVEKLSALIDEYESTNPPELSLYNLFLEGYENIRDTRGADRLLKGMEQNLHPDTKKPIPSPSAVSFYIVARAKIAVGDSNGVIEIYNKAVRINKIHKPLMAIVMDSAIQRKDFTLAMDLRKKMKKMGVLYSDREYLPSRLTDLEWLPSYVKAIEERNAGLIIHIPASMKSNQN